MDDFEFEQDFNEDYENEEPTQEDIDHLENLKDRLARANYDAIIKHGIDADKTRDPDIILNIIEETMFYFQELEEYEKCAKLKKKMELFQ
jgi:hypothetical protein